MTFLSSTPLRGAAKQLPLNEGSAVVHFLVHMTDQLLQVAALLFSDRER
jgi:hypothetical protein